MGIVRRPGWVLAALLTTAAAGYGQVPAAPPAVPGAPVLPGAAPVAVAPAAGAAPVAAAPAAAPRNIWGFFMMTPEQKLAHQQNSAICLAKFCNSRIGQFVNNMLLPAGAVTGGFLGPVCPGPLAPNPADLAKPATSPLGAAARIKAEEAQVKAKVEALEFLGTVDCRYYSEAEAALIVGLRAEKNECVRLAAARALATGCCCTPKIVKALLVTVNGTAEDKFPAERSERVRAFAYVALERCMRKCVEEDPEPSPEPPAAAKQAVYETLTPFGPLADHTTAVLMIGYFAPGGGELPAKIYADARAALAKGLHLSPATIDRMSGPKNVRDAVFPGFEPARPLNLVGNLDLRGMLGIPTRVRPAPPAVTPPAPTAAPEPVAPAAAKAPAPEPIAAAPTAMPDLPSPRTGRGNLLNLFQDARRK
jgi:hypothetical protein